MNTAEIVFLRFLAPAFPYLLDFFEHKTFRFRVHEDHVEDLQVYAVGHSNQMIQIQERDHCRALIGPILVAALCCDAIDYLAKMIDS